MKKRKILDSSSSKNKQQNSYCTNIDDLIMRKDKSLNKQGGLFKRNNRSYSINCVIKYFNTYSLVCNLLNNPHVYFNIIQRYFSITLKCFIQKLMEIIFVLFMKLNFDKYTLWQCKLLMKFFFFVLIFYFENITDIIFLLFVYLSTTFIYVQKKFTMFR